VTEALITDLIAMNIELGTTKDFWAGALLIATGGIAIFIARDYTFGNALRMGPGYFPIVLGAILILFVWERMRRPAA